MKETRYFLAPDCLEQDLLPADEAMHAIRVLRLRVGDDMVLINGKGTFFEARVKEITGKICRFELLEAHEEAKSWLGNIHLAVAPTKMMERMEWLAEKATEIGFDELSFLETRFSERKTLRRDRIEKIVASAVKQSRKPFVPKVNDMETFARFLERNDKGQRFICHCYGEIERGDLFSELGKLAQKSDVVVMIGPEGDFSIDEVRQAIGLGYRSVSLGKSRLRTETAALSAVFMSQIVKRLQ